MLKNKLILICSLVFLVMNFSPALAASIIKDTQSDFTVTGSSFESTTATIESGNIILEISGEDTLWTPNGITNGTTICAADDEQANPAMIPDGNGGAFITWNDNRNGVNPDIFLQRVDANGLPHSGWPANGLNICSAIDGQYGPQLVSDGSGGVIVAWQDQRDYSTSNQDIYAIRINSDGTKYSTWTDNGNALSTNTAQQLNPVITSNGSGGAIVAWQDNRNGLTNWDIYAQQIDSDGNIPSGWAADGIAICAIADFQGPAKITKDGSGGAYVIWGDKRNGATWDIFMQRVDNDGSTHSGWTVNGINISNQVGSSQYLPQIIADGSGGAIVTWQDFRNTINYDIYAQRIDGNASIHSGWTSGGTAICTAANSQRNPSLAPDGSGGAIIAWNDVRGADGDIYAQKIEGNGTISWQTDGVVIASVADNQESPKIISKDDGGAIIAWDDYRDHAKSDVFAQRIDSSGNALWQANGLSVTSTSEFTDQLQLVTDGSDGAIIVWHYDQAGNKDIEGQRVNEEYFSSGTYTTEKIENSDSAFLGWTTLGWTGQGEISVEVKTAASSAELDTAGWTSVSNNGNIGNSLNLWLQARVHFSPADLGTVSSTLSALSINYSTDTDAPVISNVKFDGSTAVSGMQISPSPSIEANISDAGTGVDASSIVVNIDGTDYAPDSFSSGVMLHQASTFSVSSLHNISIRATDNEGNTATWEATGLQVVEPLTPPNTTGSYFVPNPFDPNTGSATIWYNLPQAGDPTLLIFSLSAELVYKQVFIGQSAGSKNIAWDGRDNSNNILQNGVYAYKIISAGKVIAGGNIIIIK
jgi:FlgD Ig-like domain